jgi:quercetin dioxygenase-like cupin family protein
LGSTLSRAAQLCQHMTLNATRLIRLLLSMVATAAVTALKTPGLIEARIDPFNSSPKRYIMNTRLRQIQRIVISLTLLAVVALFAVARAEANGQEAVKPVRAEKLANAPGKTLTAVTVNYAPGGKSSANHHAGSVFAYVPSGAIRSENSGTGPVKVYKAGESFFEPPGSKHLVSENASAAEPASMLVVFIAYGKSSPTNSAKPIGVGAVFQRLIPTGEQPSLLMRIATTENGSSSAPTKN